MNQKSPPAYSKKEKHHNSKKIVTIGIEIDKLKIDKSLCFLCFGSFWQPNVQLDLESGF